MSSFPFPSGASHARASRRVALQIGGVLAAAAAGGAPLRAGAEATPAASGARARPLLVQSFSRGSLFPTQGDGGVLPYTLILWDAAEQGVVAADPDGGGVGIVPTERVLAALTDATDPPIAALVAQPGTDAAEGEQPATVWVLRLISGSLGSDPGAVTYQGEPVDPAAAAALLGTPPAALPDGPQDLAGYVIVIGLSGLDPAILVRW